MMLHWNEKKLVKAKHDSQWNGRVTPARKPRLWGLNTSQQQQRHLQVKVSPIQSSEFHRLAVPNLTPIVKSNRKGKCTAGISPLGDKWEPLPLEAQPRPSTSHDWSVDCSSVFPINNGINMTTPIYPSQGRALDTHGSVPKAREIDAMSINDQVEFALNEWKESSLQETMVLPTNHSFLIPSSNVTGSERVGEYTSKTLSVHSNPHSTVSLAPSSKHKAWCSPTVKRSNHEERTPSHAKKLRVGDDHRSTGKDKSLVLVASGGKMTLLDDCVSRSSPIGLTNSFEPERWTETGFSSLQESNPLTSQVPKSTKCEHPYLRIMRGSKKEGASDAEEIEQTYSGSAGLRPCLCEFMDKSFDLGYILPDTVDFTPLPAEGPSSQHISIDLHPITAKGRETVVSQQNTVKPPLQAKSCVAPKACETVAPPKMSIIPPITEKSFVSAAEPKAVASNPADLKEQHPIAIADSKPVHGVPKQERSQLKFRVPAVAARVKKAWQSKQHPNGRQMKPKASNNDKEKLAQCESKTALPESKADERLSDVPEGERACSCKKNKCLKLYCECFASSVLCNPHYCICNDCRNTVEDNDERQKSIKKALKRNRNAFSMKRPNRKERRAALLLQPKVSRVGKGCKCNSTHCLKKYCECFFTKSRCSALCRCTGCKNPFGKTKTTDQNTEPKKSLDPVGEKSLKN